MNYRFHQTGGKKIYNNYEVRKLFASQCPFKSVKLIHVQQQKGTENLRPKPPMTGSLLDAEQ
jgi:hypothetical protein